MPQENSIVIERRPERFCDLPIAPAYPIASVCQVLRVVHFAGEEPDQGVPFVEEGHAADFVRFPSGQGRDVGEQGGTGWGRRSSWYVRLNPIPDGLRVE